MSGYWTINDRPSAGSPASATQASPAASANGGQQVRLRSIQVSLSGSSAGTDEVVVRDGPSGTGTIIWSDDLSVAANGTSMVFLTGLDLRASVGNPLTVEFVDGVTSDQENVNAQGDYVPQGYVFGVP